jgi:DNA replication and repair protein RecF
MLSAARARANWCGAAPILLLDEVIAHLDVDKRRSLFDLIRHSGIQAWMTGTDAADFKGLEGFSTTLEIDGGTVKM